MKFSFQMHKSNLKCKICTACRCSCKNPLKLQTIKMFNSYYDYLTYPRVNTNGSKLSV